VRYVEKNVQESSLFFALGNLDEDEVEGNEDGAWSGSSAVVAIAAVGMCDSTPVSASAFVAVV